MTTTDLAAALLRDVPRYACTNAGDMEDDPFGKFLFRNDVLAALTAALDGVDERAGAVLQGVTLGPWLTDSGDVFADGEDFPLAMCLASRPDDARFIAWARNNVPALLAQNAALRAERDGLLTTWAESRERHLAAEAEAEKLRGVLRELIEHTHNCEKELTEELHGADFCGESLPLTIARAALPARGVGVDRADNLRRAIAYAMTELAQSAQDAPAIRAEAALIRAFKADAALAPTDAAQAREATFRDGWGFAYRQWQATGSVPDPDYRPSTEART